MSRDAEGRRRTLASPTMRTLFMSGVHHANHMFRRFLERISDCAIFVVNRAGLVESWNDGAHAIIGYGANEIIGRHLSVFYDTEAQSEGSAKRAIEAAESTGRFESENWQVAKDGRRFWAGITISAVLDDAGEVAGYGVMLRDLTERLKIEQQKASVIALLEKTAGTDFLTGVANRRTLGSALDASIAAAAEDGRPLAIAMIDLDHFKAFNDANGHQAGDAYLRDVSAFWRPVLRPESLLARYGGEEFTVVMPNTDIVQALEAMHRLRTATPQPLTCSIGVAQWQAGESGEDLIRRADLGLYAAKGAGRNRVHLGEGESTDDPQAAERLIA